MTTTSRLDLLLVVAPSRAGVYDALSPLAAIEPPVWAGLIARAALERGFSVEILDAEAERLTVEQTAERIIDARPRLAAFSVYGHQPSASTQCLPAASATARLVSGAVPTLAFGTHPSALPRRTLEEEPFNFVATGDAYLSIIEWLDPTSFRIPALWRRRLNGMIDTPQRSAVLETNLDGALHEQAWDLLDMRRYRAHNWHLWTGNPAGGYASVQTSLGCPFRCGFCCINAPFGGAGIRYWSTENVARQLQTLVDTYSITNVKIPDEMFTLNPARVKELCRRLIDLGLEDVLNMWAYARVDTVKDTEMLALMRRAGFRWLGIGIESGSKHVRDGVEKGRFGDEDIRAAVARVHAAGIAIGANYIFGLPDDTSESMRQTLDLACSLNTEWANFYCAMAYPGSALHAQFTRDNPAALPENNPCGWLGYSQHAVDSHPLPTETLAYTEVLDFRDAAHVAYFSRDDYQLAIARTFGPGAVADVKAMLALGMPRRAHRVRD